MLDFLSTAGQMVVVIAVSVVILSVIVPPVRRAIDNLEQLPRRK